MSNNSPNRKHVKVHILFLELILFCEKNEASIKRREILVNFIKRIIPSKIDGQLSILDRNPWRKIW